MNADRILVVEQGHIVEQGTHRELLEKQGLFSRLHNLQFVTAKPEEPAERS
jgi:ABC-type multidrug transport system fused ATPase/permease subunit